MGILTDLLPADALARVLLGADASCPYPTADDHAAWQVLPAELTGSLLRQAEAEGATPVTVLPATLYMEYARTGNREHYQRPYFARRRAAAVLLLAECIEGRGRFLDPLVDNLWAICDESSWVVPAHNHSGQLLDDPAHPIVDLFAAETGATLAWAHRLLGARLDALTPLVTRRIEAEVRRRILEPYMAHDHGWMGVGTATPPNNWNPWCNSNCLAAFLLLERAPARRVAAVARVLRTLDLFLDGYGADGGCDEGPSYWGRAAGSLLDCLELLRHATGNAVDLYAPPLIGEMGKYIRRMRIADTWFVNFADAGARGLPGAATVWLYGERTGDAGLRALGAWAQSHREATAIHPQIASIQRCLQSLFLHQRIASEPVARTGGESDAWMPSIEVLTARETPTEGQGFFLAARGGHNAESHNHNDVGSFVVFHDGRPLLIDVGVEVYTRKTFSPQRYEIWTMRSLYHNLPEVGGAEQCPGAQYRATNVEARLDPAETALSLDIAAAYPPQAGIRRWRRTSRLLRGAAPAVEIVDDFTLAQPTTAVALHLMAPVAPDASEAGALRFGADAAGQPVRLAYPAGALACAVEPIDLTDPHLCRVWGDRVYRIRLTATSPIAAATWTVRLERIAG